MVSVELIGGLGNQMFQIAACIAYAKRHNLEYHIPAVASNGHHGGAAYFTNLLHPEWDENKISIYYHEPQFCYTEIPLIHIDPKKQNLILKGLFQSYRYFEDYKKEVIKAFNFVPRQEMNVRTVGIHVRRGNYLLYPERHPVVNEIYLIKAIKYILRNDKHNYQFRFFSDDIQWCKEFAHSHFNNDMGNSLINYSFSEGATAMQDMCVLSMCDSLILSNSTLSLWAAHLNVNTKKTVIYPCEWFGPAYRKVGLPYSYTGAETLLDTKDLCPPDWIKI